MDKKINLKFTTLTSHVPDFIFEQLNFYSKHANSYHPQPAELLEAISSLLNISPNMIYLTAGADEGIQMFASAYGKETYCFTPTYMYYADMGHFNAHVNLINALKETHYEVPTEHIENATLFYLANPNNPVGYTPREKIVELIENNPQAIIVIDEVYAEFVDFSVIDLVSKYQNLAILRSFSKGYGMAGNRIGYIVTNPEIITKVRLREQWANISYLSVGAAISALQHKEYFDNLIQDVNQRRNNFATFLTEKGFKVFPSYINGLLLQLASETDGTKFAEYIEANNFVISHGNGESNIGLDKSFIRISIGRQEEMEQLKKVIALYQPK